MRSFTVDCASTKAIIDSRITIITTGAVKNRGTDIFMGILAILDLNMSGSLIYPGFWRQPTETIKGLYLFALTLLHIEVKRSNYDELRKYRTYHIVLQVKFFGMEFSHAGNRTCPATVL
jgi:hypothetical protein